MFALFAGLLGEGALAAVCFALHLNLATVSLLLVVGVVIHALYATPAWSVAMAVIATLLLNYFFIEPRFTWRVADPFNVVALLAFLATAVITSHLASTAREQARKAERRERVLAQLCAVGERLLALDPHGDTIRDTLRVVRESMNISATSFFDGDAATLYLEGESFTLPDKVRQTFIEGRDGRPAESAHTYCVRTGGAISGALGFEGLRHADIAAGPLVGLTIATIERGLAIRNVRAASANVRAEVFRGAVLDALAHEFKTPLAVITAASGGLQNSQRLTEAEQALAAEIESEAIRLNDLTSDLLRRKSLEEEELLPSMTTIDIRHLIATLTEQLARQHPRKRIEFLGGNIAPILIAGDRELLRLAVMQLLNNAVTYSEPGSRVEVKLTLKDTRVELRVSNPGPAIEPAERELIFQRFYRGKHTRGRVSGNGLGLYVARKIVTAHSGTLTLDPRSGNRGNMFVLSLPLEKRKNDNAGIAVQSVSC